METETIDKLFLELSQVTKATTAKELLQEVRINALFDKIAALEADAARLDYIEKNARTDPKMDGNHVFWPTTLNKALRGANLRAAIDDAMKGGA